MSPTRTAADYRKRSRTIVEGIEALKAQVVEKGYYTRRDVARGKELVQQIYELLDDLELDIPLDEQIKEAQNIREVMDGLA